MTTGRRVAVYGAYGHSGRFVVAELLRRGWTPVASGRDAGKLAALAAAFPGVEAHAASIDDPAALDRALAGTRAVIHCAGPFLDTGKALLDAALRVRIHYLDLAAEQRATDATFARDETITISRHVRCEALHSWMNLASLADLRDPRTPPPRAMDATGRSDQRFVLEIDVRAGGQRRRATARGHDIYAISAPLVVESMERIVDGRSRAVGAVAAGEALDARDVLAALARSGVTTDFDAP